MNTPGNKLRNVRMTILRWLQFDRFIYGLLSDFKSVSYRVEMCIRVRGIHIQHTFQDDNDDWEMLKCLATC